MENLLTNMIDLITNRQPLSDDMLLACWKYETSKKEFKYNKLESKLWIAIETAMNQVLKLPLSKIEFTWFKNYVFNSSLWYENIYETTRTATAATNTDTVTTSNDEKKDESKPHSNDTSNKDSILHDKLIEIVNKQLATQKNYLKRNINQLLDDKNVAFNDIVYFKEYCAVDTRIGLRQDDKKMLTYPNSPLFFEKELKKFGLKGTYEANAYLSQLIVKAHLMNDKFHNIMQNEILKDIKTNNDKIKFNYTAGPVKRIDRCQAKAETDYAMKQFPNSAQIVDLIRASICFDKCEDLLNTLTLVIDKINKGDTCLKKVLRIKNMFLNNKYDFEMAHPNTDKNSIEWMYNYCDIKLNVLVEFEQRSIICELQFLVCCEYSVFLFFFWLWFSSLLWVVCFFFFLCSFWVMFSRKDKKIHTLFVFFFCFRCYWRFFFSSVIVHVRSQISWTWVI